MRHVLPGECSHPYAKGRTTGGKLQNPNSAFWEARCQQNWMSIAVLLSSLCFIDGCLKIKALHSPSEH